MICSKAIVGFAATCAEGASSRWKVNMPEPCQCGKTPEVKEIKSVVYACICSCGNHGPAMQLMDWAISGWNEKTKEDKDAVESK